MPLAILALAGVLRFWAGVHLPFEQDELYTVEESTHLFDTALRPGIQGRPLYYHLAHPLVVSIPHTPLALRALPILFGVLGVWAIWILARGVLGFAGATTATLLAALSPWHLHASSFARYYSLLFLIAALVYHYFPRSLDSDRPRDYLIVAALLLAGAFTHPSFVFPIAAAMLACMAVNADGIIGWRWPTGNGWKFLWGPFLSLSLAIMLAIRIFHGSAAVDNGEPRGLLATLRLIPAMVDLISPVVTTAAVTGLLLWALAHWKAAHMSGYSGRRRIAIAAIAGAAAMFGCLGLLSFRTAIFADYGVAALPLVLLGAGALVQWVTENAPAGMASPTGWAVGLVLLAGVLPSTVSFMSDGSRFDYRPAYATIQREGPDIEVLTWPIALQEKYAPALRARGLPMNPLHFDSLLTQARDLWVVTSVKRYGIVLDDDGAMGATIAARCRLVQQSQRPRVDYRMYRVDLWRCKSAS